MIDAAAVQRFAGPPRQIVGGALALEHALIMLLLLVGLLSIRGALRRYVPWIVLTSVALSLFTPVHTLDLAWPLLSVLVLPPLLWQVAVRLAIARPPLTWRAWLAWLFMALLIGLALGGGGRLLPTSALLLGVVAASLIWQIRERITGSTDLGAFGQLALALLLTEVDVILHPLGPFLGSLFAGTGFGLLLGYIGVRIALRLSAGEARNLFCLGLSYLAYLVGVVLGASGVVTATMTALVVAAYGHSTGLWPTMAALPTPLNRRGIFLLMGGTLLLLGWQAHVPLTTTHAVGIGLGLVAAAVSVVIGRWLAPVPEEVGEPLPLLRALLYKQRQVFLLLLGTLLLWPQEATLGPAPLTVAMLAAVVVLFIMRVVLYPLFGLLGVELRLPEASAAENGSVG